MTEQNVNENIPEPQQREPDVFALIQKMQQQLIFLEKKIDQLINQSQQKPKREEHFSKPFRSFDRPFRNDRPYGNRDRDGGRPGDERGFRSSRPYEKRDRNDGPRERDFRPGQHFKKRPGEENRGFGGPKREYSDDRKSDFRPPEGQFKKKHFAKKDGFSPKSKPFYLKRKDR